MKTTRFVRPAIAAAVALAVGVGGFAPTSAKPPGVVAPPAPATPGSGEYEALVAAIGYVAGQQVDNGAFFSSDQPAATSGGLADTLVALGAGRTDRDVRDAALARLAELTTAPPTRAAYAGRIVQAVVAHGLDPRRFGGRDHVADLDAFYRAGFWETQVYANALAALGHVAAGRDLPIDAVVWFRLNQCRDGGFAWMTVCPGGADVDTTALVINALVAGGVAVDDLMVRRARDYLIGARNVAGGFGDRPGAETNANSTGLALSAIAALGEDPLAAPWSSGSGVDPLSRLLALQTPEGKFLWKAGRSSMIDNYATVQAIPGVAGRSYPLRSGGDPRCGTKPGRRVGRCRSAPTAP